MLNINQLSIEELNVHLDHIRQSPAHEGRVELIVRRPRDDEREIVESAEISVELGMAGDNWKTRGSKHSMDGSASPAMQITIMNSRMISALANDKSGWAPAGDQFFVDMDLSETNLPVGTRIQLGTAILEVSEKPHTGCRKFTARYGSDATKFVNSPEGRRLRLRGINTQVIKSGIVRIGDVIRRLI